ncbi:MAG: hypothetical protein WCD31_01605 [Gillisia sp.]
MKLTGVHFLVVTTAVLVILAILAQLGFSFSLVFYLTCFGQLLLLISVYKILTDDYSTDKTFDDFYEDHPIDRE